MDEVITLDDVFKCNECEFEAHKKSALVKHKETHFLVFLKEKKGDEQDTDNKIQKNQFVCNTCPSSFGDKESLRRHVESLHLKLLRFKCSFCNFQHYYEVSVQKHQVIKHKGELCTVLKIDCDDCKARKEHTCPQSVKSKGHKKTFNCTKCEYTASFEQNLKRHLRTVHKENIKRKNHKGKGNKFKCEEVKCKFSTNYKQALKTHHENIHLEIIRFKCNVCEATFYHKTHIQSHQLINHKDSDCVVIKIECADCEAQREHATCSKRKKFQGKENNIPSGLNQDLTSDSEKKTKLKPGIKSERVFCEECDFSSHFQTSLLRHKEIVHLNLKKYFCNICPYRSYLKSNMRTHQNLKHKGDKCFLRKIGCSNCESKPENDHKLCSKKQTSVGNNREEALKCRRIKKEIQAAKKHADKSVIKVLDCFKCDKDIAHKNCVETKQKRKYKVNKDNPFQCEEEGCNYSSKLKIQLKAHNAMVHLNVKRFKCGNCNFDSYVKYSIIEHQNNQHKGEEKRILRIDCDDCEKNIHHKCRSTKELRRKKKVE